MNFGFLPLRDFAPAVLEKKSRTVVIFSLKQMNKKGLEGVDKAQF